MIYLIIFLGVFFLDQLTKFLIFQIPSFPIDVTPFFNLVFVMNKGVSFSMFTSNSAYAPWILSGFGLLVCGGLAIWFMREKKQPIKVALALILGGALGNIVDRVRFGAVVDFLDFYAYDYHWPAFNIADAMICFGVLIILLDSLFLKEKKK